MLEWLEVSDNRPMPYLGFRVWRVRDGCLIGPWIPEVWPTRVEAVARCLPYEPTFDTGHRAPHLFCSCGLYAFHTLEYALARCAATFVCGAILAYGYLIVHEEGFRAERAKVIALGANDNTKSLVPSELAGQLGVPVVDVQGLEAYGLEFGRITSKREAEERQAENSDSA
jgi:hypothetical protein